MTTPVGEAQNAITQPGRERMSGLRRAGVRSRVRRASSLVSTIGYAVGSAALAVLLLGLWQVAADQGWINGARYGSPNGTWEALTNYYSLENGWSQTQATAKSVLVTLVIGIPAGVLSGLLLAAIPPLDRLLGVFLVPLNSFPRIALVPIFIIWFGLTMTTKVAVGVSIIYFIVLFNTRAGVKNIDVDILTAARQMGMKKWQLAGKVILPGSVPTIFAGIRLSVSYAILGVIACEMIAARDGLGLDVVRYSQTLRIDGVWAIILVIAAAATVINALLERFERRLLKWQ